MIDITPEYLAEQGLSATFPQRFWSKVDKNGPIPTHRPELGPCFVWKACLQRANYGHIHTGIANFKIASHRAAWILCEGAIPEGKYVCHKCDNPKCVNPAHLFIGTQKENITDMMQKGRYTPREPQRGSKCKTSKLCEEDVQCILREWCGRRGQLAELGRRYGVAYQTIGHIVNRDSWKHVTV